MKTTKRRLTAKKIENLVISKRVKRNSKAHEMLNDLLRWKETHTIVQYGSTWKYSSIVDHTSDISNILRSLEIPFKIGNDAPCGGKLGTMITI